MIWKRKRKLDPKERWTPEIDPDEIFLDSHNLPEFDTHQFEGRIERPIGARTHLFIGTLFLLIGLAFFSRAWHLQVKEGKVFAKESEDNRLRHDLIFAPRGVIYDRNNTLLVSNVPDLLETDFAKREYIESGGFSHILGYVKYPKKDKAGFYYNEKYEGMDGVEKFFQEKLEGKIGLKILETDARGNIVSENVIEPPKPGEDLILSVDAALQSALYASIKNIANKVGFIGGAAALMDVRTGEVLASVSFPEYDSQTLSDGKDVDAINELFSNKNNPFLDRVVNGLYTPGSIVKPYIAVAALEENIINPLTTIVSTGSISLPNIYFPSEVSVFKDWKAHGAVDMRKAIAVSSDVYFYEIGGGYERQKGLGISLIKKYMKSFGFGSALPNSFFSGKAGVIPDPDWKKENFDGEDWRVGDTYHTAIGQYGFQVTPIQALVSVATIANDGKVVYPTILKTQKPILGTPLTFAKNYFQIVKEGMRLGVVEGTAAALHIPGTEIAAKTGTAELGASKQYVNSWVTGFWPENNPKYAFVAVMEKGPRTNTIGASAVMRGFFDWILQNKPEYFD